MPGQETLGFRFAPRIRDLKDTKLYLATNAEEYPGLRATGVSVDDTLRQYRSPLGWEHINLTGDYIWRQDRLPANGRYRPLRMGARP